MNDYTKSTEGDDIVLEIAVPDHDQVRSVAPMLSPREWHDLACEVRQEVSASIPALVQSECDRQLRKARGRVD